MALSLVHMHHFIGANVARYVNPSHRRSVGLERTKTKMSHHVGLNAIATLSRSRPRRYSPVWAISYRRLSLPYRHAGDLTTVSRYACRECDAGSEAEPTTNDEAICIQRSTAGPPPLCDGLPAVLGLGLGLGAETGSWGLGTGPVRRGRGLLAPGSTTSPYTRCIIVIVTVTRVSAQFWHTWRQFF